MGIKGFARCVKALFSGRWATPRVVPKMVQTPWGYRLSTFGAVADVTAVVCAVSRLAGLVLVGLIMVVWGFSGAFSDPLLTAMIIGLTGLLFVAGWLLFWHGWDMRQTEAQIDLDRGELRVGHKNGLGRFEQEDRIPFGQIGSLLILRGRDAGSDAGLYVRLGNGMDAFELLSGSEAMLVPIRSKLLRDLKGAHGPVYMR